MPSRFKKKKKPWKKTPQRFNSLLEVLQIQHLEIFLTHVWHLEALMQPFCLSIAVWELGGGDFFLIYFWWRTVNMLHVLTFFFQISLVVNRRNGLGLGSPCLDPYKPLQTWPLVGCLTCFSSMKLHCMEKKKSIASGLLKSKKTWGSMTQVQPWSWKRCSWI